MSIVCTLPKSPSAASEFFCISSKFGLVLQHTVITLGQLLREAMKTKGSQLELSVVDADTLELSGVFAHRNTQGCAGTRASVRMNRVRINELLQH